MPGAVDGWFELHARFGRLPIADLLAPAIRAAREGEPVPQVIAGAWARAVPTIRDKPGFAAVFLPGGRAPREGEVFRNPALARAYELLARDGRDAFYRGAIAHDLVAFSQHNGGLFSAQDLAAHRSEWVEPDLHGLPRRARLRAAAQRPGHRRPRDAQPPGELRPQGDGARLAAFWHIIVEAKKLAFEDRARFVADPAFAQVPVAGLLSKDYGRERARLIDLAHAARRIEAGHPPLAEGDTTYLAVADGDGNMVSLIQSNYIGFGSGYVLPEWGFGIQNRGALFDLEPGLPNPLEPGKRPFHTIIPAFASRDGKPWLAFGLMGGDMQPQGHAQVLVNIVDFGMNLQEAGDAPRFHHEASSEPTGTLMTDGGELHLESGVSPEVRRELVRMGHNVTDSLGSFGGYQAVARDPVTGVLAGASESRKDGCAMGY